MRIEKPRASIKPQVHTTTPVTGDATIMDDTVVTMDSATALMGGLTTSMPVMKQTVDILKPRTTIRVRR